MTNPPPETALVKLFWRFYYAKVSRCLKPGLWYLDGKGMEYRLLPLPCDFRSMHSEKFAECNIAIAESQEEYHTIHAYRHLGREGSRTMCWKLSWLSRLRVLFTGRVWHTVLTFNAPLQPIHISTYKPYMPPHEQVLREAQEAEARDAHLERIVRALQGGEKLKVLERDRVAKVTMIEVGSLQAKVTDEALEALLRM